jgi:hypothetical protein
MRAVPFNSAERDGVPLPALHTDDAVSQLIWRALGPLPDVVHPMLGWVTGGAPVSAATGVAWTRWQLDYRITAVQAIGRRTPLRPGIAAHLMHPTRPASARCAPDACSCCRAPADR